MAAPKAANPEKGWSGTKNYQVFDESGTKYLASPNIGIGSVQENDKISITIGNPDRFGNLYIKSFEPVTAPTGHNEVPQEIKEYLYDTDSYVRDLQIWKNYLQIHSFLNEKKK